MTSEFRTADKVLREKYEDRGWNQETDIDMNLEPTEQINPLPLSQEEYERFSLLLAKLALHDKDPKLCEMYFDLQRRASYGNGYPFIEELSEIEQEMWSFGTGEKMESSEKHI